MILKPLLIIAKENPGNFEIEVILLRCQVIVVGRLVPDLCLFSDTELGKDVRQEVIRGDLAGYLT